MSENLRSTEAETISVSRKDHTLMLSYSYFCKSDAKLDFNKLTTKARKIGRSRNSFRLDKFFFVSIDLSTKYLLQKNTHISINVFKWQHSIRIFVCRRLSLLLMASMASNIRNNKIRVSITLEFDVKCNNTLIYE